MCRACVMLLSWLGVSSLFCVGTGQSVRALVSSSFFVEKGRWRVEEGGGAFLGVGEEQVAFLLAVAMANILIPFHLSSRLSTRQGV